MQHADHWHSRLLRARGERPRRRTADQRDELAPLHSITSSARASTVGGISRPSALAVFRLISNSYLVGAWTGSSPGPDFQTDIRPAAHQGAARRQTHRSPRRATDHVRAGDKSQDRSGDWPFGATYFSQPRGRSAIILGCCDAHSFRDGSLASKAAEAVRPCTSSTPPKADVNSPPPKEILIASAKRLLQQNLPIADSCTAANRLQ
jgi:hypothetical protein